MVFVLILCRVIILPGVAEVPIVFTSDILNVLNKNPGYRLNKRVSIEDVIFSIENNLFLISDVGALGRKLVALEEAGELRTYTAGGLYSFISGRDSVDVRKIRSPRKKAMD